MINIRESKNRNVEIVPVFQKEAFEFVKKYHRHHVRPVGSIFQIGVRNGGNLVGVVIVGRPVARRLQDGYTAEVTRLCTDGTKNACSMLYSAAWRVAKNLGYKRLITYILSSENGTSLYASGWRLVGFRGGGSWDVTSRRRIDKHPIEQKKLFEISNV